MGHTTRDVKHLKTRLNTLKKEFNISWKLKHNSGWGWDEQNHKVRAPSREDLRDAIKGLNQRWHYVGEKRFIWFNQMEEVMGGSKYRGDKRDTDFPTTQGSGTGSHTDSSNDPQDNEGEFEHFSGGFDNTIQCEYAQPSSQGPGTDSFPRTESSGSHKRKSSDSGEPSSRAKRVHESIREKRTEIKEMNETTKAILQTAKDMVSTKRSITEEMDLCARKMDELQFHGHMQWWLVQQAKDSWFRRYFLHASKESIKEAYNCAMREAQPVYAHPCPSGPYTPPHGAVPSQTYNPVHGAVPTQAYNPQTGTVPPPTQPTHESDAPLSWPGYTQLMMQTPQPFYNPYFGYPPRPPTPPTP